MGLVLATTFALVVWIVLWACGAKSFDAFMIATVITLILTVQAAQFAGDRLVKALTR